MIETDLALSALDAENPKYSEPVRARLRVVSVTVQRNIEAINVRTLPHARRLQSDAEALVRSRKSKTEKIYAVWSIADAFYAHTGKNVACRRGCSHCCHIAVAVTPEEAEAIGKRIGRAPRTDVRLRENPGVDFDFGYHNPCSFLKNGECSIYKNRPLACRIQYSLDVDPLLCELSPPRSSPVPYMNPTPLNLLLLGVLEPTNPKCLADIREYFPPKK